MNSKLSGKDILFIFVPSNEPDISFNPLFNFMSFNSSQKANAKNNFSTVLGISILLIMQDSNE